MSIRNNSVIFLLGAGCSADANVPMSNTMIHNVENLLEYDDEWKSLSNLYYYVKFTIEYGNKISKNTKDFNIETLLVVLHGLSEHRKALLYPFTTGYNNDLIEYAGENFENINKLIKKIVKVLPNWVTMGSYQESDYYKGFATFQQESNYALRIFSLNYDLCVENNITNGLETGFAENMSWDGGRFNKNDNEEEKSIYLYKLHGSIDWERRKGEGNLLYRSQQQGIKPDIIFGTDVKLQAIDPYLFYLYEFRKYIMSSNVIVVIGYSFNDSHINDLLRQGLESDENKKLISVSPCDNIINARQNVIKKLGFNNTENNINRVIIENKYAKTFLEKTLTVDYINSYIQGDNLPF